MNITRKVLSNIVTGINQKLNRPVTPYIETEGGFRQIAEGHLSVEQSGKAYNFVEFTREGIRTITSESKSAREMESFLAGLVLQLELEKQDEAVTV